MFYYQTHILKELLIGSSRDREIVENISLRDSSLRTDSVRLAFVTGENALGSQNYYRTCYLQLNEIDLSI